MRFFGRGLTGPWPSSAFRVFERTRPGRCARSVRAGAPGASGRRRCDWVDRFDDGFTEVWSASSKKSRVISERTAALLNWRYELQAGADDGPVQARRRSDVTAEVRAYLVLIEDGSTWRLMEIAGVDGRSQEILLAGVLAHARTAGADKARAVVVRDLGRACAGASEAAVRAPEDARRALLAREVSGSVPPWARRSDRVGVHGRRSRPVARRHENRRRAPPTRRELSTRDVPTRSPARTRSRRRGSRRACASAAQPIAAADLLDRGHPVEHVVDAGAVDLRRTGRRRAPSASRSARARAARGRRSRSQLREPTL